MAASWHRDSHTLVFLEWSVRTPKVYKQALYFSSQSIKSLPCSKHYLLTSNNTLSMQNGGTSLDMNQHLCLLGGFNFWHSAISIGFECKHAEEGVDSF